MISNLILLFVFGEELSSVIPDKETHYDLFVNHQSDRGLDRI
jgi:hypothetical protein